MDKRDIQDRLAQRAALAGVAIDRELGDRLETYLQLLATWNAKINLTALPLDEFPPETIDRLLIEPLVAATHVAPGATRMLDVGSGGGSPAIPLVLARPNLKLLMVESRTRKAVFLLEAVRALGIPDAEVVSTRAEQLVANPALLASHDLITLRAVRPDFKLLRALRDLLRPGGELFLFGRAGDTLSIQPGPFEPTATHPLVVSLASQLTVLTPAG